MFILVKEGTVKEINAAIQALIKEIEALKARVEALEKKASS